MSVYCVSRGECVQGEEYLCDEYMRIDASMLLPRCSCSSCMLPRSCLDLSANRITSPTILDLLAQLPNLKVLYLKDNDVVQAIPHYRRTVIARLKGLTYLDERPIDANERAAVSAGHGYQTSCAMCGVCCVHARVHICMFTHVCHARMIISMLDRSMGHRRY